MSDFKTKMYQIQFRMGLCPDPAGGAYSAPPDPPAGLRGPTSKGRGKDGKKTGRAERGSLGEEKGVRLPRLRGASGKDLNAATVSGANFLLVSRSVLFSFRDMTAGRRDDGRISGNNKTTTSNKTEA